LICICLVSLSLEGQLHKIDASRPEKEIFDGHLKLGGSNPTGDSISFNNYFMMINEEPAIPVMGEFHFSRYPYKYWEESILKMKAGGMTVIPSYVFWNIHEEEEGVFDWTGDRNLRQFIELCAKNNVWTIVRIGPFCHGEIRNGGLPDWLYGRPFQVRSLDEGFLFYVDRLYKEIGRQLEGLMFKDGGPIIGIQLENECQHSASPWSTAYAGQPTEWTTHNQDEGYIMEGVGSQNKEYKFEEYGDQYMRKLKEMAIDANMIAPIYTATGWGYAAVIENETLPVTAAYAYPNWAPKELSEFYLFKDIHANPDYSPVRYAAENYPSFCAEMSGGMMVRYTRRPKVPPLSLEGLIVRSIGSGANGIGYYMYHGGSTPMGKYNFLSDYAYGYPKISYDFQAPIREYGQLNESFYMLKTLHMFLMDFGSELGPAVTVLPENAGKIKPGDTESLRYAVRVNKNSGFVFMTNFQDHADRKDQEDLQLEIKLPDGKITIPEKNGFSLKKDVSAIFPFNLSMAGVQLNYATGQLLTKFEDAGYIHYVFYEIDGTETEFQFNSQQIENIESITGNISDDGNHIYFLPEPGLKSTAEIIGKDGRKIKITTLTRDQALYTWKVSLNGMERIIISKSTILDQNGMLKIQNIGNNTMQFNIYPDVKNGFTSGSGRISRNSEGLFSQYNIELEKIEVPVEIQKVTDQRITLNIPEGAMTDLNDIFLKIDYIGDTGMGFINGKLVTDHFYYGEPWWIGLKRFVPEIMEEGMYFYFKPIYPEAPYLMDLSPDEIPDFQNGNVIDVKSVDIVPEYQVIVSPK